jgi:hypothetical protein
MEGRRPSTVDLSGGGLWDRCPETIETDFDVEDLLVRMRPLLPVSLLLPSKQSSNARQATDLRLSTDPGPYLCAYIYYASLAYQHSSGSRKNVVFAHVPADYDGPSIERGVDVISRAIEAMADQISRAGWRLEHVAGGAPGIVNVKHGRLGSYDLPYNQTCQRTTALRASPSGISPSGIPFQSRHSLHTLPLKDTVPTGKANETPD